MGKTIEARYVVYQLNEVMNSKEHKALSKFSFKGFVSNSFETEYDAVQALINDEMIFQDFVIIRHIRLTDY